MYWPLALLVHFRRALAMFNYEERSKRETKILSDFRELVHKKINKQKTWYLTKLRILCRWFVAHRVMLNTCTVSTGTKSLCIAYAQNLTIYISVIYANPFQARRVCSHSAWSKFVTNHHRWRILSLLMNLKNLAYM